MSNSDLIVLLGLGVMFTALAIAMPGHPKTTWLPALLGLAGVVCGAVAVLVVIVRG